MRSTHKAFIAMANSIACRPNCVGPGAILVRAGQVLATGWNAVLEGHEDCSRAGCPRCISGGDTGSEYEECACIYAEQMAIADAALRGVSTRDSIVYVNLRPCLQCLAIAKAAGARQIFFNEDWTVPKQLEGMCVHYQVNSTSSVRWQKKRAQRLQHHISSMKVAARFVK